MIELNRKVLGLALVLLFVAMLATPMVGMVQAKKTIDVYTRIPGVDPPTVVAIEETPGDVDKFSGDGHMWIRSGTQRTFAYDGPLGTGTGYQETIITICHISDIWIPTPLGEVPITGYGHSIYKLTFVIDDGSYGAGTLSGTEILEWEWDLTDPNPLNARYEGWGYASLKHGTGDFAGVKVNIESYFNVFIGITHKTTTVISP